MLKKCSPGLLKKWQPVLHSSPVSSSNHTLTPPLSAGSYLNIKNNVYIISSNRLTPRSVLLWLSPPCLSSTFKHIDVIDLENVTGISSTGSGNEFIIAVRPVSSSILLPFLVLLRFPAATIRWRRLMLPR